MAAPDLTVRWVDVHPKYTTRSESAAILAALDVTNECAWIL
jgi:hypothetical protein